MTDASAASVLASYGPIVFGVLGVLILVSLMAKPMSSARRARAVVAVFLVTGAGIVTAVGHPFIGVAMFLGVSVGARLAAQLARRPTPGHPDPRRAR